VAEIGAQGNVGGVFGASCRPGEARTLAPDLTTVSLDAESAKLEWLERRLHSRRLVGPRNARLADGPGRVAQAGGVPRGSKTAGWPVLGIVAAPLLGSASRHAGVGDYQARMSVTPAPSG